MTWRPAAILFPDIELVLTTKFRAALAARTEPYATGVFVSNAVPNPRRDRMVIVRRDGGTPTAMRDRPRVTVRVWAMSEQDATDLARLVMALAPTLIDGSPIVAAPTDGRPGPNPVADESGQPMRMLSIEFHTRPTQLT